MTITFQHKPPAPVFRLITGWHRGREATAYIDAPRSLRSPLEVQQTFSRLVEERAARGLSPWFARIEFPDGDWSWLADYRGTLRNGNGNGRSHAESLR